MENIQEAQNKVAGVELLKSIFKLQADNKIMNKQGKK